MRGEFVCRFSTALRHRLLLAAIAVVSFVAIRVSPRDHLSHWAGWAGLALTGLCAVALTRIVLIRGPLVRIDEDGIEERLTGYGHIPWTEIRGAYITEMRRGRGRFLSLEVDHPETYVARLPLHGRILARANTAFGTQKVMINFSLLSPGPEEALRCIAWHLRMKPNGPIGRCPACGYDLRASPEQCPECGRPVGEQ